MPEKGIYLLPVILFILFPTTFLGTYIAAVLQGHVEPAFPYISDAATYSPESCVFGQFINIGCVLLGLVVYTRYRHMIELMRCYPNLKPHVETLNKTSVWMGLASSLGLSMVANFQETNVIYVHFTGALICFGFGTAYFWIQAICSYHLQPFAGSRITAHIRLALSLLCTVFFISAMITGIISHLLFHGTNARKWYPSDGGWEFHVCSTASEWVVASCFCFYILSFSDEFQSVSFDHPQMCLVFYQESDTEGVDSAVAENVTIENVIIENVLIENDDALIS